MGFLTAEEEEMLQDAYNTIKSIDSHLSEIQKAVVPEDGQEVAENPPADEKMTEPAGIPESESVQEVIDYTEQLKQISGDLQMQVKLSIIVVFGIGIVAGLMVGKIMWGKIHAG